MPDTSLLTAESRAAAFRAFRQNAYPRFLDRIFDGTPGAARLAELSAALEAGDLEVEGNTVRRAYPIVYGASLKESDDAKELHLQRALSVLDDEKLAPYCPEPSPRATSSSSS